jgi:leucyl aminopeptidase (aminopeptidase T)
VTVLLVNLGTEFGPGYLSLELAAGVRKLVEQVMLVKPGENVVITTDSASDFRVVEATAQAVYAAGAAPAVVWYETRPTACLQPPAPVARAVEAADVWIEYAVAYIMHSEAFRTAMANGVRYICLTGMDVDMLVKTVTRIDYPGLVAMGEKIRRIIEDADEVIVTSPAGTRLTAYNRGRKVRQSGKLAEKKGDPIMLGGQVSWCPLEETINGTLVFDGALWPPLELGLLQQPVTLTIEQGIVTTVTGGAEARTFERWLKNFGDSNMYRLAHYSLGFNPGVSRPTGRIVEDERVFGCIEMGIGSQGKQIGGKTWTAASHTDGIVLNPTIYLDGQPFEIDGRYVHPEIAAACRELGVAGY